MGRPVRLILLPCRTSEEIYAKVQEYLDHFHNQEGVYDLKIIANILVIFI